MACDGWVWFDEGPRKPADGRPFSFEVIGTRTCTLKAEGATSPSPQLLGVEVQVTGWADAGVPANYYYARLEDEEGRQYSAQEGCEPLLQAAPLRPGQQARGFVSFAVPAGRRAFKLVYEPRLVQADGRTEPARFEVTLEDREGT